MVLRCAVALSIVLATSVSQAVAQHSAADKIKAGRAALIAENPRAALDLYRGALAVLPAEAHQDRFVVLIGIARAASWLEQYVLAERSYRDALGLAQNDEDRTIAAAGLSEMMNVLERPRKAYAISHPFMAQSLPHAVQAARAALALDRTDQARAALEPHALSMTPEIAESRLGRTFRTQQEELAFQTEPVISTSFEYTKDSDNVRTYDVAARRAMFLRSDQGPFAITRWDVAARHQTIDDGSRRTEIPQLEAGIRLRANDDLKLAVIAGAADARGWTYPVITGQLSYRPADDWGIELSTEHDAVRTVTALASHVDYSTATVAGDNAAGEYRFRGRCLPPVVQ